MNTRISSCFCTLHGSGIGYACAKHDVKAIFHYDRFACASELFLKCAVVIPPSLFSVRFSSRVYAMRVERDFDTHVTPWPLVSRKKATAIKNGLKPVFPRFFSREQAKSECDWVMMSSVFVAIQSSCFLLCF